MHEFLKAVKCLTEFVQAKYAIAPIVLVILPHQCLLATEPVTVIGADLVEYGVYRSGLAFQIPPNHKARRVANVREIKLLKKTDLVSAALGTRFGIRYTISGAPSNAEVNGVVEIIHPQMINPKSGKASTVDKGKFKASIGVPAYYYIDLDQPGDVVPGQWTFRLIYNSKALLEKSFEVTEARQLSESEATIIEDVPVFGRVDAVIADDIHEIIKEATDNSTSEPKKPRAIEVMSADEVRAYLPERALGWRPLRITPLMEDVGPRLTWGFCGWGLRDTAEALRLIRTADEVYIFPLRDPFKPERDDQHLRRLGPQARRDLARLLGYEKDWFEGNYSVVFVEGPPDPNASPDASAGLPDPSIGFVFRSRNNELVLFFIDTIAQGTFNGESTEGKLERSREKHFERWKKRYARQELPTPTGDVDMTSHVSGSPAGNR